MKIQDFITEAIQLNEDMLFEMANIVKSKSGLDVDIWSEHRGVERNVPHNLPRIKLSTSDASIVISIEPQPELLALSNINEKNAKRVFSKGIKYVGDNYDLFKKHYMDLDDSFDDEMLFAALRERGVYK